MTRITEWLRVLQADCKPQSRKQQNTPFGVSTAKKTKATPSWDRLCLIGRESNYFVASLTFSAAAFTASAAFCAASTPASTFSAVSTTCSATSSTLVCSQASASSHSVQSASVHSSAASTTSTASSATASASAAGWLALPQPTNAKAAATTIKEKNFFIVVKN